MSTQVAARTSIMAFAGWRVAVVVFAVAVIVLFAGYWHTVESLVTVWAHSGTYQYAFLIFPLSLSVAISLRRDVHAVTPRPSAWGLLAVAALAFIWYTGHLLDINLAQHFAFVALFPALVLACWGWRILSVLKFPLGYLVVFAVPWGGGLVGPLQDITAHIAVRLLDLTGTPVLLNGREILTPTATWMVADACSGVKFFIACTALGCLYAYLMYQRTWKRILFVVLSAVVPIIANGLRVYFTVLIGEAFGLKYATGTDHMIFGWQFFGTVLVLLLLVGWFFRDVPAEPTPVVASHGTVTGVRRAIWPASLVLLVAAPLLAVGHAPPAPTARVQLATPTLNGWGVANVVSDDWHPVFKGATSQVQASYRSDHGNGDVELFHAVFTGDPRAGHSLIAYGNDLFDTERMRILSSSDQPVVFAGGRKLRTGELRLAGVAGPRLVWYWYCVDSRCTRSPVLTKMLQAWAVLRGHVPHSAVWAISSRYANNAEDQARAKLRAFAKALSMEGPGGSMRAGGQP